MVDAPIEPQSVDSQVQQEREELSGAGSPKDPLWREVVRPASSSTKYLYSQLHGQYLTAALLQLDPDVSELQEDLGDHPLE